MQQNNYNYYLYHHGILGQKWGKRNGPPYPLGSSDHSTSEKKAGWRKSLDKQGGSSHTKNNKASKNADSAEKDGFHLTDKQKKALKIGAAAVAASLAAYGAYRLAKSGKLNELAAIGKTRVDGMLGKKAGSAGDDSIISDKIRQLSSETGFKLHSSMPSIEESCRRANPDYDRDDLKYRNNCGKAVVADILNNMGLNVKAKGMYNFEKDGMTFFDVLRPFKGSTIEEHIISKSALVSAEACKNDLSNKLLSYCGGKEKAMGILRAEVIIPENMRNKIRTTGHFMKWQIENGKVVFSNSQVGNTDIDNWFIGMANEKVNRLIEFSRLDGLNIDDLLIEQFVENI